MDKENKEDSNQKKVEKYKAGEQPLQNTVVPNHPRLSMDHIKFLEEYSKHLDVEKAAKVVPQTLRTIKESWLKSEKFAAELAKIEEIWATNVQMTAEHASARHIKLMDKMEKHLDDNDTDTEIAAKVMNPLAKMSDTYLKAAGKFNDDSSNKGISVNINITKAKDEPIIIEGEEVEDGE